MAIYLVKAKPVEDKLAELRTRLDAGEVREFEPFGRSLEQSLRGARRAEDGDAVWEEVDYCSPPLQAEREAILDDYFERIEVEPVGENEGWKRIEHLPPLWNAD